MASLRHEASPAMSADETALLRAICENPADDTVRLVYADWLEEHGEPERAEFIRVQIEFQNTRKSVGNLHPTTRNLLARAGELLGVRRYPLDRVEESPWYQWAGPDVARMVGKDWQYGYASVCFRRGFIDRIECTWAEFVGGACSRRTCHGGRVQVNAHGTRKCPHCDGTGRTPGLAGTLFGTHPITTVVLKGKQPDPIGSDFCWLKSREGIQNGQATIPAELFDLLNGGRREDGGAEWQAMYGFNDEWIWMISPTRETALDALSRAAVGYARSLHGYQPLATGDVATG